MNKPLVSVIIPTYKRYDLLDRAICSVINQTYKNVEIIVVDDNQPDSPERKKTEEVVSKYKSIVYLKNDKKLGGSRSRNKGIDVAKGEFIAFLDDDDEFLPTKIEEQYKLYKEMNDNNIGIIYCYVQNIDENGNKKNVYKCDFEGNVLFEHMAYFIATTSTWFCKKSVLVDIGKFEDVPSQQDTTTLMNMLVKGYKVYRVPKILLNYSIFNNRQKITKISENYIQDVINYQNKCRKNFNYLSEKQVKEVEYNFSIKLFDLYNELNKKDSMKMQLKKIIKYKFFSKRTIKRIINYYLSR